MKLQRGNFTVRNIDEFKTLETDKDGLKDVIDLSYMGKFEFEGNAIPLSRMFIEYNKENYVFHYLNMFDGNGDQMIVYGLKDTNFEDLPQYLYENDYSFYDHIKYPNKEYATNFWWNISVNYFILFGEEKKELINYFINGCYERDGGKQLIKQKLTKYGYKLD